MNGQWGYGNKQIGPVSVHFQHTTNLETEWISQNDLKVVEILVVLGISGLFDNQGGIMPIVRGLEWRFYRSSSGRIGFGAN